MNGRWASGRWASGYGRLAIHGWPLSSWSCCKLIGRMVVDGWPSGTRPWADGHAMRGQWATGQGDMARW
eukprot:11212944-Lingulodinium_polyedra.AAC.1